MPSDKGVGECWHTASINIQNHDSSSKKETKGSSWRWTSWNIDWEGQCGEGIGCHSSFIALRSRSPEHNHRSSELGTWNNHSLFHL